MSVEQDKERSVSLNKEGDSFILLIFPNGDNKEPFNDDQNEKLSNCFKKFGVGQVTEVGFSINLGDTITEKVYMDLGSAITAMGIMFDREFDFFIKSKIDDTDLTSFVSSVILENIPNLPQMKEPLPMYKVKPPKEEELESPEVVSEKPNEILRKTSYFIHPFVLFNQQLTPGEKANTKVMEIALEGDVEYLKEELRARATAHNESLQTCKDGSCFVLTLGDDFQDQISNVVFSILNEIPLFGDNRICVTIFDPLGMVSLPMRPEVQYVKDEQPVEVDRVYKAEFNCPEGNADTLGTFLSMTDCWSVVNTPNKHQCFISQTIPFTDDMCRIISSVQEYVKGSNYVQTIVKYTSYLEQQEEPKGKKESIILNVGPDTNKNWVEEKILSLFGEYICLEAYTYEIPTKGMSKEEVESKMALVMNISGNEVNEPNQGAFKRFLTDRTRFTDRIPPWPGSKENNRQIAIHKAIDSSRNTSVDEAIHKLSSSLEVAYLLTPEDIKNDPAVKALGALLRVKEESRKRSIRNRIRAFLLLVAVALVGVGWYYYGELVYSKGSYTVVADCRVPYGDNHIKGKRYYTYKYKSLLGHRLVDESATNEVTELTLPGDQITILGKDVEHGKHCGT